MGTMRIAIMILQLAVLFVLIVALLCKLEGGE